MKLKVNFNYISEENSPLDNSIIARRRNTSIITNIRELADAEAPLAFILHHPDKPNQEVRVVDGEYFWQMLTIEAMGNRPLKDSYKAVTTENVYWNHLFYEFNLIPPKEGKEQIRQRVLDKAKAIIIVGGKFYRKYSEPVYELECLGKYCLITRIATSGSRYPRGTRFTALERELMHDTILENLADLECKDDPFESCYIEVVDEKFVNSKSYQNSR